MISRYAVASLTTGMASKAALTTVIRPDFAQEEQRAVAREVALTYRRVQRRRRAEGASVPDAEHNAVDAAIAKYQELDPDAPRDKAEASRTALMMIANAIRVNTAWFWHGPDA